MILYCDLDAAIAEALHVMNSRQLLDAERRIHKSVQRAQQKKTVLNAIRYELGVIETPEEIEQQLKNWEAVHAVTERDPAKTQPARPETYAEQLRRENEERQALYLKIDQKADAR